MLLTGDLQSMVTEWPGPCQVAGSPPHDNNEGRPQPPVVDMLPDYCAVTNFSCAIIEAIVSRMDSMLRPVSVATST